MDLSLSSPLQYLKGVGPKRAAALTSAGLHVVSDLLFYFPRRYLDRTRITTIAELAEGEENTVVGEIRAAALLRGRRARFEATLDDGSGRLQLVFFHNPRRYAASLKKGVRLACTGVPQRYLALQMIHPEFEVLESASTEPGPDRGRIVPIYPGTGELASARIDSRLLRRLLRPILESGLAGSLPDPLPDDLRERAGVRPVGEALRQIHFPDSLEQAESARRRFAFDELFVLQVHLAHRRAGIDLASKSHRYASPGPPERQLLESLPFALTSDQKRVLREIMQDMAGLRPMHRLLQGDVGAGKTVVAAFALHLAVRSGFQAAIMAPTEILAEQHFSTLTRLLKPVGIDIALLSGSQPAAVRRKAGFDLAEGRVALVVGTHALIQDSVRFCRLALAVVDEQHRFGVHQRAKLAAKGEGTDVLVMTATPIPRTLQLTLYGDLDLSTLRELPPGRAPVVTRLIGPHDTEKLWRWLGDRFDKGDQAYLVYPIIEESEKQDLKAATSEFERLGREVFTDRRVALLHGRTPPEERRETMDAFRGGHVDLLVATTVIEIGVDVPNANIMIIEHAERFGLSQLHQLRGRIRRGSKSAYCIAVAAEGGPATRQRLRHFIDSDDGFALAEADLTLRGPGELIGSRQHGLPGLRVADLAGDLDLLETARREAAAIFRKDPDLSAPEWGPLRDSLKRTSTYWSAG